MKLRLSPRARDDLREIGTYLYARNPRAAARVRAEIQRQLKVLVDYPQAGRRVGRGLRRSVVPRLPYLIIYRADEEGAAVLVVTIRHTARREEA